MERAIALVLLSIFSFLMAILAGWPIMLLVGVLFHSGLLGTTLSFQTSIVVAYLIRWALSGITTTSYTSD